MADNKNSDSSSPEDNMLPPLLTIFSDPNQNSSSPFYIHPSESPSSVIVTPSLSSSNYLYWSRLGMTMGREYYYKKSHVPAFGSWDWNENLPFTQCFETARQAGLLRCSCSESEDRDLYVTGDLYENDVVTPAMIVVPRRKAKVREQHEKETKMMKNWVSDVEIEPPSPNPLPRPTPKPVDEDLYKISPGLLYAKAKKKRGLCFFSSCLLPTCIA
ncbi:uncharacterized protein LOC113849455 [Abrus precatorius]|uniref:Uncharacterized protein LOC113849455 n=1 Tax=Abrus precatorius TaxID=3816 RepID=A0A8B8JV12_ABRPR|nr:uncharacterized protein LOC113849455 [Abrus precatorius]